MTRIPPIGSSVTAGKVVSKITEKTKNGLPWELHLTDRKEQDLINMLHPGTPFYNAKNQIQETLNTQFDSFIKKG